MIFVTVGTHEQQFNRLIQKIDELKRDGVIEEPVFIQTGFSTYEPKYCEWKSLISFTEMNSKYKEASIIITHGGPASFMKAIEIKKVPIVVPRQVKFGEHINDHQVEFSKFVENKNKNIIVVEDINYLKDVISSYYVNVQAKSIQNISNNIEFNSRLYHDIENILNKK